MLFSAPDGGERTLTRVEITREQSLLDLCPDSRSWQLSGHPRVCNFKTLLQPKTFKCSFMVEINETKILQS